MRELLSSVPSSIRIVAHSLCDLCQRIDTLSLSLNRRSVFHPSKCRCLAHSYSALLRHVLSLTSSLSPSPSSSPFLQLTLPSLLTVLLHTSQGGERFIQDCFYRVRKQWLPGSALKQRRWLITKGLPIALSTEIVDVHLHDLVWCTATLIWGLAELSGDEALYVRAQLNSVHALLKDIWAFADEENDVKSMQEQFNKIRAQGDIEDKEICDLICHRLSESASNAKINLADAVVPTYLWLDPRGFRNREDHVLGSNDSIVVFETKLMGGRFARKRFHCEGHEEVFGYEALVHARLRHANVVHLVCCTKEASEGNARSLVMELMDQDLGSLIKKRRLDGMYTPFSLLVGVDLILQIAKGMKYLHDLGIMHRDLKSYNILVHQSEHASYLDKTGHINVKIADFGTSKVKHDTSMYTTKGVGTSIWRAPEVLDVEDESKYTKKADVYSFAIVCSEILTGLPPEKLLPYNRRSELLKLLKEGRRPELPSSCPPAISSYIKNCWHGDASKRPTFNQICTMFRFFKACILLREEEMLASPLQDDMFEFEEPERTVHSEGMFYHLVLDIPLEMHGFRSILREQKFSKRSKLEHQGLKGGQEVPMEIMVSELLLSSAEVLGRGSLGSTYKCMLDDGSIIVVKRLKKGIILRNLKEQLADMVKLKHENLVPLLAYLHTEDHELLVSEYMTNGSCLADCLYGDGRNLDWDTRVQVALSVANGVSYLHDEGYTHGSIKSSNILLTDNDNCILSDYGIAELVGASAEESYGAPDGRITKRADVYSYGMLLLELLTGENPAISENGKNLWLWVQSREEQIEIFKSLLFRYPEKKEEMVRILQIASECVGLYCLRPTMKRVVKMVENLGRTQY